ncbi:Fur family transcriptional regulator, zinc uptake regulator [Sphingobium sp. AP50]|jgi:Fur family zinc uptake transcriptional regulator|uniref:Fur family transcriptional regulator n=1 Tax=unclassified Sphingobium TaxID=2611147 RepID=UPI0008B2B48D|nr:MULTISPECIES: transcriptional repressor [unclassified Sphingobium]SEJ11560.1 Fur family transcriptional regulator, zinc uptake regulator [Sphingobium sp. AP50]SEQ83924.1 Fur family transcriptional regulator, zinc uptake regulator [Sphingobium sp. YR768]
MADHDHHHHQEPTGAKLANAARATLEAQNEQWTPMRAAIFDALAAEEKPASAYDIADNVSKARGKRVAPNSVYRILDLFVANNIAMRVESANAYIANAHPGCHHDCIFLVCDECGQVTHIDNDPITSSLRAAADKAGFTPKRAVIEMRGTCNAH